MIGLRIRKKAGKVKWSWRLAYEGSGVIEFVEPAAGGEIMAVITIPGLRPQVDKILPGTFKHAPTGGRKTEIKVITEEISYPESEICSKLSGAAADAFVPKLDISGCETIVCVRAGLKEEGLP